MDNSEILLSNGNIYPSSSYEEKVSSFMEIRSIILKLDQLNLENQLNELFSHYNINWKSKCESLCLSWDEIEKLSLEPLVTLGGHTQHHYNLKQLTTEAEVKAEVKSGLDIFYSHMNFYPSVFAYPFGSELEADIREFQALSEIEDLKIAVRSVGGFVTTKNFKEYFSLPRIMFTDKMNLSDLNYFKGVFIKH